MEQKNALPEPQLALLPALAMFATKATIIAVLCTASIITVGAALNSAIESKLNRFQAAADQFGTIGSSTVWEKLERELARLGDPKQGPSPEKQQRILTELRAANARWRPFLSEINSILSDGSNPQHSDSGAPVNR